MALTAVLGGLGVLAVTAVYSASEWKLRRTHDAPLEPLPVHGAAPDTAEGRRMAQIVGCWSGCHGMRGEGDAESLEGVYSVTAPTLSDVLPRYSDAELVRLIRYGVKRDGRSALGMISATFYPLGNADLANIVAHLRAQPATPPVPRRRTIEPRGRLALALGTWKTSADAVDRSIPRWGELRRTTGFERGRYLASITCSECHGLDFRGDQIEGGPSLAIVGTYRLDPFRQLLRTGVPIGGRDLGIMSWTARNGFTHFTDREIEDLYHFLRAYHGVESSPSPTSSER